MIEDKEIGLKIAERDEERVWENVRKEAEILIQQSKDSLMIQEAMKELAEKKLKKYSPGRRNKSESDRVS